MGEKFQEQTLVLSQREIAPGIYDLWVKTENIAAAAKAGQFVSLFCADQSRLLPRPISICERRSSRIGSGVNGFDPVDAVNGAGRVCGGEGQTAESDSLSSEAGSHMDLLRLVYRTAGAGTKEFSSLKAGDSIRILGPLGNGFPIPPDEMTKSVFLIGGGIGIPPMLELAKELAGKNGQMREKNAGGSKPARDHPLFDVTIIAGYRDSSMFLLEDLKKYGEVCIATEDGSFGTKGNVLDAIREKNLNADVIYACGPAPMLRAVRQYAAEKEIECWVSMEERMACGIGACLACVCRSGEVDVHTNVRNKRICREGPVFRAEEIEI